ncbi:MAG: HTTM domain-containing protein [Bacteroidota bacterium]
MINKISIYLKTYQKTAPLAVFRLCFGAIMAYATASFVLGGWVEAYYITPQFHFKYFGFEWVKPLGYATYGVYALVFCSAIGICVGYKYRISTILFFLSFTYTTLLDKTYYLNHYYFIILVSFLLIFIPAHCYFSVDAYRNKAIAYTKIPRLYIDSLKLMLCIVYICAGLAKINSDWLSDALPLSIWLPVKSEIPLLGSFLDQKWVAYAMSWGGMLYDLSIPFLLLYRRTRWFGFTLVIIFHVLTKIVFPKIGIFPLVMITSTLLFFDAKVHLAIISFIKKIVRIKWQQGSNSLPLISGVKKQLLITTLIIFFSIQLVFPFRYLLYPDELFWTEEGYPFSWRVMLTEKGGSVQYRVLNPENDKMLRIEHAQYLTPYQEKQLRTKPDFIIQFAHYLKAIYQKKGIKNPKVYVDSYISLNGRLSQRYIDPNFDLTSTKDSFKHKDWILPFNDTIYGF